MVFIDESGLLMAPLVRRSWSPRGQTPVLYQRMRSHQHVSVMAALCIGPSRDRVSLCFRLHPKQSIRAPQVRDFLRQLTGHLQGSVVLVWDRLAAHRSRIVHRWLQRHPGVHVEFLPPYAPELNPVEYVWSYLKSNPLANIALTEIDSLTHLARCHSRKLQHRESLLRSFVNHSPLFLRLK